MSCSACFSDFLVKCNTEIILNIQLPVLGPYDSYKWVVTDKFGHKYSDYLVNESTNQWSIDVDALPAGLLTQYAGTFHLEIQDLDGKVVDFKIAQMVDCIEIDIHGGTMVKDNLGIEF